MSDKYTDLARQIKCATSVGNLKTMKGEVHRADLFILERDKLLDLIKARIEAIKDYQRRYPNGQQHTI